MEGDGEGGGREVEVWREMERERIERGWREMERVWRCGGRW